MATFGTQWREHTLGKGHFRRELSLARDDGRHSFLDQAMPGTTELALLHESVRYLCGYCLSSGSWNWNRYKLLGGPWQSRVPVDVVGCWKVTLIRP